MPGTPVLWIFLAGCAVLVIAFLRLRARERPRERLALGEIPEATPSAERRFSTRELLAKWPGRWLSRAGYRNRSAIPAFLLGLLLAGGLGAVLAWTLHGSPALGQGMVWLGELPGGIGDLFLPALYLAPWIVFFLVASVPWLLVRDSRRRLLREVEQDLPVTAELLATLGEAGIGFDSALERILASGPPRRALSRELGIFRRDVLLGVPRVQALRRLGDRVEDPHLSTIVAALIQAEQVGAGMAGVLRRQAEDLRNRRRERALQRAQSLPVKLTVPLVVCFFPAIVIAVLGPTFFEIFQMLEVYLGQ